VPSETQAARKKAGWLAAFGLRLLIALPIVGGVWALFLHPYNRLLCRTTEWALHLLEEPEATRLDYREHVANLRRLDFAGDRGYLYRIRVTDLHFPTILAWALIAATPGASGRRRFQAFALGTCLLFAFHTFQLALFVQAVYATQLGGWSEAHYSFFARNAWGLANHVVDLALKFAVPLALWALWFYRDLTFPNSHS
jgi:hypothetical protein